MTKTHPHIAVAVVGLGPRGLGALEALVRRGGEAGVGLGVEVFDAAEWPGAGPNFSPSEHELCLLNIPLRAVSLGAPGLAGAEIGGFGDWLASPGDPDRFPARAELGRYLTARFERLMACAGDPVSVARRAAEVHGMERGDGGWWLQTGSGRCGPYHEVLLALGQPVTAADEQLARWQAHAAASGADLVPAYPAHGLLEAAAAWAGRAIAIRGLGLSTLDVLRLLTAGQGGRFENGRYHRSGREPQRILPFSLDGHAPAPKPATARLDEAFNPLPAETARFERALAAAVGAEPEAALGEICSTLVPAAVRVLRAADAQCDARDVERWLATERDEPGAQEIRSAVDALKLSIAMAEGASPPSPGYVIGQLWRKWQDELRAGFNTGDVKPATAAALVGFDEGLKRFSYGPPVRSARELMALIEAGVVELRAADDPAVLTVEDGWQLVEGDVSARVTAIVDAVLPSPVIADTEDPLTVGLKAAGRLSAVGDGLGARTAADGQLIDRAGNVQTGLSLLGRLALGSVIAADSIHDCFGPGAERWAAGAIARGQAAKTGLR